MLYDLKLNFRVQYTNSDDSGWVEIDHDFDSIEYAKTEIKNLRLTNYENIVVDYRIVLVQELTTVVYEEN